MEGYVLLKKVAFYCLDFQIRRLRQLSQCPRLLCNGFERRQIKILSRSATPPSSQLFLDLGPMNTLQFLPIGSLYVFSP